MASSGMRPIRSGGSPAMSRSILSPQNANHSSERATSPVMFVNCDSSFRTRFERPDRTMFERSMFSDTLDSSWAERSRRGWTTLTSFGLQALVTSVLLLLPLLRPMGLPSFHQLSTPISLGQPLAEAPAIEAHAGSNRAPARPTQIV